MLSFIISHFSSVHYSLLGATSSICLPILAIKGNQSKCHPKPNPNLQPKLVPPLPNHSNSLVDLNTANSNGNTKINRNRSNSLLSSIDDCGDHDQNELLAADNRDCGSGGSWCVIMIDGMLLLQQEVVEMVERLIIVCC